MYVKYFQLRRGLWVGMARKVCWLAYYKIEPDVLEHPGTCRILHFTYYVLGHTKSFSGILNSKVVVWVLECRDNARSRETSPLSGFVKVFQFMENITKPGQLKVSLLMQTSSTYCKNNGGHYALGNIQYRQFL